MERFVVVYFNRKSSRMDQLHVEADSHVSAARVFYKYFENTECSRYEITEIRPYKEPVFIRLEHAQGVEK